MNNQENSTDSAEPRNIPIPPMNAARDRNDELEVWRVIREFNAAFARNDPEAYFAHVDEEITVLTPSNPYRVEGLAADREEFEQGIRTGRSRVAWFQEMQPWIRVSGDMAVVSYFSRGGYGAEGREQVVYLKETDVLVRRDGRWKVVHVHVSGAA